MAEAALSGIRVVELGEMVSAPYCAKLFADYGADVVKLEPSEGGDIARSWGPFPKDRPHLEKSGLFHFLNTNKRSVALDVGSAEGREKFLALIDDADVLIENQKPSRMRELGLDYASLSLRNPRLVMISITPYGQTGPYADWNGYDLNAFHLSGASSRYCGRPDEMPLEHGTYSADFFGAVAGASWGLAAVLGRDETSHGEHVDVSCAEVIAATFVGGQCIGGYAQDGIFDKRTGVGLPLAAPATICPCKDGHVWMLALEPGQWRGLVKVMGDPDWAQPEIFDDMFVRGENADWIYPLVTEWASQHAKMEIMDACQAAGAPVTAVFTVGEAARHPHMAERDYITRLEHGELGSFETLGAPFKMSRSPGGPRRAAPTLGEHTDEVLGKLSRGPSASSSSERAVAAREPRADRERRAGALPLAGLRVVNFGWVWAGPVVGQTLSFLGAEVYKVESYARVDMTRNLPPHANGVRDPNRSLSNNACWAGNGSVSLNLKKPEARKLALELVALSDVVIENFAAGVMDRLGLSYEELRKANPGIIYFSMPPAGLYGPLRDIRTYGLSLTSTTGLDSLVGYHGGPPIPMENAYSDPYSGVFGAFAVLTALAHRNRTGEGQHIDFSQQEAVMQMVGPAFLDFAQNGRDSAPLGNRHPGGGAAPHGVFPCTGDDRWISIAVRTDEEWRGLLRAMGEPAWASAPPYASLAARLENIDALHRKIGEWTSGLDDRELAARLQGFGVAAAPVLTVGDLLHDPHWQARQTFVEVDHPLGYRETIYGEYVKLTETQPHITPGPWIGQDNDHVFLELLGLSEERYQALKDEEVIF